MSYERLLMSYRSELNDLSETIEELKNTTIIDAIQHDILIDDLFYIYDIRKALKKYEPKDDLIKEDERLLMLKDKIKEFKDTESKKAFISIYEKFLDKLLLKPATL